MRSASTDSKTPYNYTHTSTIKAAWSHRYTAAKKKRQTDRSRTRRTHEVAFIAACSHFTRKNTRFRAPASSPRHSPCNIMQPLQCGSPSTRKLAPIYAQNNTRTPNDNSHAAIPMRSASTDSKTPYNYAHTSTPKAASSHRYTAAKKKRQTDRSRTRRTHEVPFIVACSHFTRKNTRFRAPASSPNHSPCNIMQPLQCGSQHQLANLHLSTHRTTPEHQMRTVMQPFQMRSASTDSKTPYNYTHTSTIKAAWSHRYTAAKKKRQTDRSRTRRTHEVAFIAACSHFTRKNTRFRAPASSPDHSPCNIHAAMTNNEAAIALQSATRDSRTT